MSEKVKTESGRVLKITRESEKKTAPSDHVGKGIDEILAVANGGRGSIAMKRVHVERVLKLALEGAPVAWTFGAKSMSSKAAFVLAVREKHDIVLVGADVRRVDANKGPLGAFPSLVSWDERAAPEKDIPGETAEKREAARAAGRGIELHAVGQVTDPVLISRLKALPNKAPVAKKFSIAEVAGHFGAEV